MLKKASFFIVIMVLLIALRAGCQQKPQGGEATSHNATTRTVVDMAGRNVPLPAKIERVATIGPVPVINSFVMAMGEGNKIVNGLPDFAQSPRWKYQTIFAPAMAKEPSMQGPNREPNIEELLKARPDVVFTMDMASVDVMAAKGLPVVFLAWRDPEDVKKAIKLVGDVFNKPAQAEDYIKYFDATLKRVNDVVATIPENQRLGVRQVHLSGGTSLEGYDAEILAMVRAIRNVSDIDVEVNLGPSLAAETVRALKEMQVRSITSSLETFNEYLFQRAKPGDSLARRKALLELCEAEGMSLRSIMLVGLGESYGDRVNHLFYLRGFRHLYHLRFSRFYPYPGTAYSEQPRCSPWELARTVAVARLILPRVELGLAAGNTPDDIPLWLLAGGGNQLLGITVSRKPVKPQPGEEIIPIADNLFIVNHMPIMKHYAEGMGFSAGNGSECLSAAI